MDPLTWIFVLATGLGLTVSAYDVNEAWRDHQDKMIDGVLFPGDTAKILRRSGVDTLAQLEVFRRIDLLQLGMTRDQVDGIEATLEGIGRSLSPGTSLIPS